MDKKTTKQPVATSKRMALKVRAAEIRQPVLLKHWARAT